MTLPRTLASSVAGFASNRLFASLARTTRDTAGFAALTALKIGGAND